MHKLIFVLWLAFTLNQSFAQSCRENVESFYQYKVEWMHSPDFIVGNSILATFGTTSTLYAISLSAALPLWIILPIGVGVVASLEIYKNIEDRHQTMVDLAQAEQVGTDFFKRLVKRAQRKNASITENDIAQIIQDGFESGELCDETYFVRPHRLKKFVTEKVEQLYDN